MINNAAKKAFLNFQKNEITEYYIYKSIAKLVKEDSNRKILEKIAQEELNHYKIWEKYSQQVIKPNKIKFWFYVIVSVIFGVIFSIKMMEKGEDNAQLNYKKFLNIVPELEEIINQESDHENYLVNMINEEKIKYMGSVVLGLNDALVEFTGALAGFTLALKNSILIGITGLIMGFSASLSMAASEYLSTKTEAESKNPFKSAIYTGSAYVLTVFILVFPYFFFKNYFLALIITLISAVFLILVFTFYFSVVKEVSFKSRFLEMLSISLTVAGLSFFIGFIVREILGVNI